MFKFYLVLKLYTCIPLVNSVYPAREWNKRHFFCNLIELNWSALTSVQAKCSFFLDINLVTHLLA